ncbi:hypothetical protein ACSS7Z_12760 [Microbacterium sp. A82]|uniref:hypothetical protein n=1 Tax=Microbacterium sp. A82 TaxID=3450452 RepID=UPI003F329079
MSVAHDAMKAPVPDATTVRGAHDPIAQLLLASPAHRAVMVLLLVVRAVTSRVMVLRAVMVLLRAVMVLLLVAMVLHLVVRAVTSRVMVHPVVMVLLRVVRAVTSRVMVLRAVTVLRLVVKAVTSRVTVRPVARGATRVVMADHAAMTGPLVGASRSAGERDATVRIASRMTVRGTMIH